MISARIRSFQEYIEHRRINAHIYGNIQKTEDRLVNNNGREFTIKGFSYPAQEEVRFKVDYLFSDGVNINWRERVICPVTKFNSRIRASIHFIDTELNIEAGSIVYIAEQLTPLYSHLSKKYENVIGSEFLGASIRPGSVNKKGIRHEDATNLSFHDEEIDFYLSFECFEHIPDVKKAFAEGYRVLKENGMMFWSVPFANLNYDNVVRAVIDEKGVIDHILPPEYHEYRINPDEDVLCYTHFGWEMLDQLKEIGFRDAYAITYWCDALGYYGGDQFLFCAIK